MQLTKIAFAAAAAFGATAPAFALDSTLYNPTTTADIRISGATAQDAGLIAAVDRFCVAGTMTRYSISNNAVFFCTMDTNLLNIPGKSQLAVYKFSQGGSGNGVQPVNGNPATLPFMDLTKLNGAACTGANRNTATRDPDGTGTGVDNILPSYLDVTCGTVSTGTNTFVALGFSNTSVTTAARSFIGLSDVEPSFFGGPAAYDKLVSEGFSTVIFGFPVTRALYEKLQQIQGKSVGATDEANMPSLTKSQLTTMMTRAGQTFTNVLGTAVNTGPNALASDTIYVARRSSSSGTQKTFEGVIIESANSSAGGKNCKAGSWSFVNGTPLADNTAADNLCGAASPGGTVWNASGTDQVVRCLEAHHDDNRGAIGTLTTESKQSDAGKWRFVKISDKAPTHANVASGAYTAYGDSSINIRATLSPSDGLGTFEQPGYTQFVAALKAAFADPATIKIINGDPQPWGPSGLMALDALASPIPVPDFTGASARNPWTRVANGSLNNCLDARLAR